MRRLRFRDPEGLMEAAVIIVLQSIFRFEGCLYRLQSVGGKIYIPLVQLMNADGNLLNPTVPRKDTRTGNLYLYHKISRPLVCANIFDTMPLYWFLISTKDRPLARSVS